MKIAFLTRGGARPYAHHCERMGHVATIYTDAPDEIAADAVIADGHGWADDVARYEAEGIKCYFGGKFFELCANNPAYMASVCRKAGINVERIEPGARALYAGFWLDGLEQASYAGAIYARYCDGDMGPMAVSGCTLIPAPVETWDMLTALRGALRGVQYRGMVTLVFSEDGQTCAGMVLGLQPQVTEAFCETIRGGLPALISGHGGMAGDCAVSVVASLPPWPNEEARHSLQFQIPEGLAKHFWPIGVERVNGHYEATGTIGVVGTVTARGRPGTHAKSWLREANWRALRSLSNIPVNGLRYRTDIT